MDPGAKRLGTTGLKHQDFTSSTPLPFHIREMEGEGGGTAKTSASLSSKTRVAFPQEVRRWASLGMESPSFSFTTIFLLPSFYFLWQICGQTFFSDMLLDLGWSSGERSNKIHLD